MGCDSLFHFYSFYAESEPLMTEQDKHVAEQAAQEPQAEPAPAAEPSQPALDLSPEEEIASLHVQLAELQEQIKDRELRAAAEVQNARRRADEEVSKARKFALEGFAESLLPVIDSLEAGLAVEAASAEQLREGTDATLRQLLQALERNKVQAIAPAAGDKFDPHVHQAISAVPSELPANTVVTLLQKGYSIAERVIRPALVMVAAEK